MNPSPALPTRLAACAALLCLLCLSVPLSRAQDGLNLPADLFVLITDGRVERYAVGAGGVSTVSPAGEFVVDFGVDATGARLAFRTESGLFLTDLTQPGAGAIAVEGPSADVPPFRGVGDTLAWSPGGDALAYTTTYGARVYFGGVGQFVNLNQGVFKQVIWSPGGRFLAGESESEGQSVWWIYRRDGATLTLTSIIADSAGGIAWLSDSEVVFAPVIGGLRLMQLDQANAQVTLLEDGIITRLPAIDTSDGLVFFARDPLDTAVPDGYGTLLRLARGAAQTETLGVVPVALASLAWSPGARLLVTLQGGVMAVFDPTTGGGFPLPINGVVAYDWGAPYTQDAAPPTAAPALTPIAPLETATPTPAPTAIAQAEAPSSPTATPIPIVTAAGLVLSRDGYFLAPVTTAEGNQVVRVWRLPASGGVPVPFTRNTSDAVEFAVSPIEQTVVYVVDAELWAQVGERDAPFRLARLNSFAPASPVFSPDGTTVIYADEGSGVWRITLEAARAGEDPELLRARALDASGAVAQALRRPQISPDGTKLLIDVYTGESLSNDAIDLVTRETAVGVGLAVGDQRPARTAWLRDGRAYTLADAGGSASPPGVYRVTPPTFDGGALAAALDVGVLVRAAIEPLPGMLRLLVVDSPDAAAPIRVLDVALDAGTVEAVTAIGPLAGAQISADGRFVGGTMGGETDGVLTVIDLLTGARFVISSVSGVRAFAWG